MKRILFAAAALAAFGFSSSAMAAATAEATVTINGKVGNTCTLTNATQGTVSNASFSEGVVTFDQLAAADTALLNKSSVNVTYSGMCNTAHKLTFKATNGGLVRDGRAETDVVRGSDSFIQAIGYVATVGWAGADTTISVPNATTWATASGKGLQTEENDVLGANKGTLNLQVNVTNSVDSNVPVVAGDYTETLTITLAATA